MTAVIAAASVRRSACVGIGSLPRSVRRGGSSPRGWGACPKRRWYARRSGGARVVLPGRRGFTRRIRPPRCELDEGPGKPW